MRSNLPTFIKWAGGKKQLLPEIEKRIPNKFNNYFEPFVGGGAVMFLVASKLNPKKIIISDINKELIITYKIVKERPNELIELLKKHKKNHDKNYYYEIRELGNNPENNLSDLEIAGRFIYLNKTCFNGLYRVNSKGSFNVPIGSYKNPNIVPKEDILNASKLLQKDDIKAMSFENVINYAKNGDFVYFDPPYLPLSKTSSFTSYTKNSFSKDDHKKLSDVFKKLDKIGCFVMLSNSYHPYIEKLYSGFNFNIETVKASRAINCNGSGRGKINELLITNYEVK
jgi:DNA adenine methylase